MKMARDEEEREKNVKKEEEDKIRIVFDPPKDVEDEG